MRTNRQIELFPELELFQRNGTLHEYEIYLQKYQSVMIVAQTDHYRFSLFQNTMVLLNELTKLKRMRSWFEPQPLMAIKNAVRVIWSATLCLLGKAH